MMHEEEFFGEKKAKGATLPKHGRLGMSVECSEFTVYLKWGSRRPGNKGIPTPMKA